MRRDLSALILGSCALAPILGCATAFDPAGIEPHALASAALTLQEPYPPPPPGYPPQQPPGYPPPPPPSYPREEPYEDERYPPPVQHGVGHRMLFWIPNRIC